MGEVLLTWDRERGEEVALKSVRLAEVDADVVEAERNGARLQRELARAAPHVPRVFEEGDDDEFYYYIMEYVAGKDLSQVLARGPLPEHRAIGIAIQLFDFLARLHSFAGEIGGRKIFGIIHGDIKPENIRLQDDDRVRVIDFGIAKQLSLSRSYTKNAFGSLPYLPPERLEHGRVDVHSDLWAAAVALYSMVGGRLPYSGTTEDVVVRKIRSHDIAPLPSTCSRSLQWIIHKGLSFEIDRRFPTAGDFKEQLEILRAGGSLDDGFRTPAPQAAPTQPSQPVQTLATRLQPEAGQSDPELTQRTATPSSPSSVTPVKVPGQVRVRPAQAPPVSAKPVAEGRGFRWTGLVVLALLVLVGALALSQVFRNRSQEREMADRGAQEEEGTASDSHEAVSKSEPEDQESRARLHEDSPDVYLGLARSLVDGNVPDEDRFAELQEKAQKRGFKDTGLFTVALADAYLAAGKRLLDEAGSAGGPYDIEALRKGFRCLEKAVRNYDEIKDEIPVRAHLSEALELKNRVAEILANTGDF